MKLGALFGLTQSVNVMPYIAELSSEDRLVLLLEYERARPGGVLQPGGSKATPGSISMPPPKASTFKAPPGPRADLSAYASPPVRGSSTARPS